MKNIHHMSIWLLAVAAALQSYGGEVSSSSKRQGTLDLAARLLAPRANPAAQLPDNLPNPFNPEVKIIKGTENKGPKAQPERTDRETLEKIATGITPSGMMMLRDKPILIFREKKLKVGDNMKVNYGGFDYVVVVTAIESSSFTLRLNSEEVTRPIKPGKNP